MSPSDGIWGKTFEFRSLGFRVYPETLNPETLNPETTTQRKRVKGTTGLPRR